MTRVRSDQGQARGGAKAGGSGCTDLFFFSSRRRHTRFDCDWSSDVCSSDLRSREEFELIRTADVPGPSAVDHAVPIEEHGWTVHGLRPVRQAVSFHAERAPRRSEEHTSELQSQSNLVCRLLLEKKKATYKWS